MKKLCLVVLSAILGTLVSESAFATTGTCLATSVAIEAGSKTAGATAHLVAFGGTSCSSAANKCAISGFGNGGYVELDDKELFAHFLSNAFRSTPLTVQVTWEVGATAKGSLAFGTTTCRLISVTN